MDFDEPMHGRPSGAASLAAEVLDDLSVYELEDRLDILKSEIARTEKAIENKKINNP